MKKNRKTAWVCALLCLLLMVPGMAETREGVIALEGMEETIEETLFESPQGFTFWYASDLLEAYPGEMDNIDGVVVDSIYSEDYMVLSMISEEDAAEYTEDCDENIVEQSADSRVQMDLYRELEDGEWYFLTLIAENGQYFRAVGQYAMEAAEGNAKFFQRALDSVVFVPGSLIRADWGDDSIEEEDFTLVVLTAMEPVTDVWLLNLDWEGTSVSWEMKTSLGNFDAGQSADVTIEFIGDLPNNGIAYTDAAGDMHVFSLDISGEDGSLLLWALDDDEGI